MTITYADRVKETSTTTGTGAYSLAGAEAGFQGAVVAIGDGNSTYFCAEDGTDWEVFEGTITDGTPDSLSRDKILASSNANAAVNWGVGEKRVFNVVPAVVVNQMLFPHYGVSWDESADEYERTGALVSEPCGASPGDSKLPIQRNMRRCVVNDSGSLVYYLDPDSSYNQAGVSPSVTGTDDTGTASKVSDAGVFTAVASEYVGKYVHNTTDDTYAMITAKDSNDVLSIGSDIMAVGETFEICTAVLDGTDGQVMVEIPKFYFKYGYSGTVHTWEISNVQLPGFDVHPAFVKAGVEVDARYVGAYEGYLDSTKLASISGQTPTTSRTRAQFRSDASARGSGWHQQDFYLTSAVQLLYLTEYADFDSQSMIGDGNTKYAAWPGVVGTTGVSNGDGNGTGNQSTAGGAAGDYMTYRGIENFYGHFFKWVDGFNINDNVPYVCQDPDDFADDVTTGYSGLGVTLAADNNYADTLEQVSDGFLPATVGASSATKLCDYYHQGIGWRVARFGGTATYGLQAGAFCWTLYHTSSYSGASIGGRICY